MRQEALAQHDGKIPSFHPGGHLIFLRMYMGNHTHLMVSSGCDLPHQSMHAITLGLLMYSCVTLGHSKSKWRVSGDTACC